RSSCRSFARNALTRTTVRFDGITYGRCFMGGGDLYATDRPTSIVPTNMRMRPNRKKLPGILWRSKQALRARPPTAFASTCHHKNLTIRTL
ncbi:MAG: hypothetical protein ACPGWR_24570, partial [Ardenticatenaceae bacterium]